MSDGQHTLLESGLETVRTGKRSAEALGDRLGESPLTDGVVGGVLAYVVGYCLVYASSIVHLNAIRMNSGLQALGVNVGAHPPTWKLAGWLFYGSHYVSVNVATPEGILSRNLVNVAVQGLAQLPYFVLPPVLLAVAGRLVGNRKRRPAPRVAAARGASILLGYLPLSAVGAYLTYVPTQVNGTRVTVGPNLWMAALFAGGIYPVVFGGVGGLVGAVSWTEPRSKATVTTTGGAPVESAVEDGARTDQSEQTLSDAEYVMRVIDDHDGRIKQKGLVEETGWSKAKVSRITSALEDDGYVEKLRIGRENIVRKVNEFG